MFTTIAANTKPSTYLEDYKITGFQVRWCNGHISGQEYNKEPSSEQLTRDMITVISDYDPAWCEIAKISFYFDHVTNMHLKNLTIQYRQEEKWYNWSNIDRDLYHALILKVVEPMYRIIMS